MWIPSIPVLSQSTVRIRQLSHKIPEQYLTGFFLFDLMDVLEQETERMLVGSDGIRGKP